jgi:hypothetical protein
MNLSQEQTGILFMYAGLSARAAHLPVQAQALRAWIQEENADGIVERETIWLYRSGYVTTVDGHAYGLTKDGWAALDSSLIAQEQAAEWEEQATGEHLPREPLLPAREELPDTLILIGEWFVKAEAQRLAATALQTARIKLRR